MRDCNFCKKSLIGDSPASTGVAHDICLELCDERIANNICFVCGKNPIDRDKYEGCKECETCGINDGYLGYPGP